ncbi:MAG: DUF2442 domain-containing protein [Bryobacteraceae bacterium]
MRIGDDSLGADLADGRTITVPLAWFPRLAHASPVEAGRGSSETQESLRRWLQRRQAAG